MAGSSPAGKLNRAARRNRRKNDRQQRRRLYQRLWQRTARRRQARRTARREAATRQGLVWWQRRPITRVIGTVVRLAWRVGGALVRYGSAVLVVGSVWWMQAAHRVGNRVRALHRSTFAFLAVPFEGLGADMRRLARVIVARLRPAAATTEGDTAPGVLTEIPRNTNKGGDVMSGDLSSVVTNLRPLIEAISEAGPLGGGDKPHAVVVARWHEDAAELMRVLSQRLGRDAGIAAETLPVSGSAHEITHALASATAGYAVEFAEATTAWKHANGTRWERLTSDETNKESWDHSTRPDL